MAFRLFFPDSDPLTVFGPNNSSYWLMLVVRIEAIHQFRAVYFFSVIIEAISLVFGYALHVRGFVLFWKLRAIHVNFLLTVAALYTVMIIGAVGRLLTIPFETRIVQFAGLYAAPLPFLAILRQATYAHAFYILWLWTIERTCATIYVVDYEKHTRLHISLLLNAFIIPFSYLTGYAIVTRLVNAFIVSIVALVPNIGCAFLFRWLILRNERRLSRLTHHVKRHPDQYSLSLRVQLKENVWSMKKIEFGVYLLTAALAANLVMIFAPVLLLITPGQFETLQWLTCAGNLVFALTILCTSPWLEVAIAIHTGKVPPILQLVLGKEYFNKKVPPNQKKEIDEYFNQLDSQWSACLSEIKTRK